MLEKFKKLAEYDANKFIRDAIDTIAENSDFLIDLQKEQWNDGEDKKDNPIGFYKPYTEAVAKKESPIKPKKAGDRWNLQWTGDLFRKMVLEIEDLGDDIRVNIQSLSPSEPKLLNTIKYHGFINEPTDIFGFQKKNKDEAVKVIGNKLLTKMRRYVL